jgi:hypothetical protein
MRKVLFAIAFGFLLTATTFADSMAPPSSTSTVVGVSQTLYCLQRFTPGGSCLPPGSIWATFLWPGVGVGLSSPLTWRPDPPDPIPPDSTVPEPSTLLLLLAGLAILIPSFLRARAL